MKRATLFPLLTAVVLGPAVLQAQQAVAESQVRVFNTVKLKLADGAQVVGGTVATAARDRRHRRGSGLWFLCR